EPHARHGGSAPPERAPRTAPRPCAREARGSLPSRAARSAEGSTRRPRPRAAAPGPGFALAPRPRGRTPQAAGQEAPWESKPRLEPCPPSPVVREDCNCRRVMKPSSRCHKSVRGGGTLRLGEDQEN